MRQKVYIAHEAWNATSPDPRTRIVLCLVSPHSHQKEKKVEKICAWSPPRLGDELHAPNPMICLWWRIRLCHTRASLPHHMDLRLHGSTAATTKVCAFTASSQISDQERDLLYPLWSMSCFDLEEVIVENCMLYWMMDLDCRNRPYIFCRELLRFWLLSK